MHSGPCTATPTRVLIDVGSVDRTMKADRIIYHDRHRHSEQPNAESVG